jgi:hypothetical protein
MFRRLLFEDYATLCTAAAFAVSATIFLAISSRALRMPREQTDRLANLPFTPDTAHTRHDERAQ